VAQWAPIHHGTDSGYRTHKTRNEPICEPCRQAHITALARWRSVLYPCRDCGEVKRRASRGRCGKCYTRMRRAQGKKS
jgi:hypothetical protein